MTKFIVIASGKGGVGKTTAALSLGSSLSDFGRDVIVVDANVSKPNIGLHLGRSTMHSCLKDALKGNKNIREIVFVHPSGLKVIPSSIRNDEYGDLQVENLAKSLRELDGLTELVLIDASSGLNHEALHAIAASDEVILVTTPDILSVTDALKTARTARKMGKKIIGVIINRVLGQSSELTPINIELILESKVIGIIPEDDSIRQSLKFKHPVAYSHPESPSAVNFKKVAAFLIGQRYEYPLQKESQFGTFLKKTGIKP